MSILRVFLLYIPEMVFKLADVMILLFFRAMAVLIQALKWTSIVYSTDIHTVPSGFNLGNPVAFKRPDLCSINLMFLQRNKYMKMYFLLKV